MCSGSVVHNQNYPLPGVKWSANDCYWECFVDAKMKRNYFDRLPTELLVKVCSNLDFVSAKCISKVCRRFRKMTIDFRDRLARTKYDQVIITGHSKNDFMEFGDAPYTIDLYHASNTLPSTRISIFESPWTWTDERVEFFDDENRCFSDFEECYKVVAKSLNHGLIEAMKIVFDHSEVDTLIFNNIKFTTEFCDLFQSGLSACSVETLRLCTVHLKIPYFIFGGFISRLGVTAMNLDHIRIKRSLLTVNNRGDSYFKKAIEMNPQLADICLDDYDYGYGDDDEDCESMFEQKQKCSYGKIMPTHICSDKMTTRLDEILVAIKEWTLGKREFVYVATPIDQKFSIPELCNLVGIENVRLDPIYDPSVLFAINILNHKRERLRVAGSSLEKISIKEQIPFTWD